MGNRALIVFHNADKTEWSPVIYLHWHDAAPIIAETAKLMADRKNDVAYAAARCIGIASQRIEGNLSLGTWNLEKRPPKNGNAAAAFWAEMSHGDQGVYLVDANSFKVARHA